MHGMEMGISQTKQKQKKKGQKVPLPLFLVVDHLIV